MSGCICSAKHYDVPHAVNCPAHPDYRPPKPPRPGEAVLLLRPSDLEPAWTPEEEARWKFEQES